VNGAAKLFLLMALLAAGCMGFLFHQISEEDRIAQQRERDWLSFSMQHHCRIARDSSFSEPSTLWQCDGGFQVKRTN
jgi:hypothetical protein